MQHETAAPPAWIERRHRGLDDPGEVIAAIDVQRLPHDQLALICCAVRCARHDPLVPVLKMRETRDRDMRDR